jgi:PTS system nitrogen regulatory IIA component
MQLAQLLTADRIMLLVEPVAQAHVLDAAARLLGEGLPEATHAISAALRAREELASTAIGRGVAIPHARGNLFRNARGAFLRLSHPVAFPAPEGQPVDLVFAMCVPDDRPEVHLQCLAGIAEHFADAGFLDRLRSAPDLASLRGLLLAPGQRTRAA